MKKYKVQILVSYRYEIAENSEWKAIQEALKIWEADKERMDAPLITVEEVK